MLILFSHLSFGVCEEEKLKRDRAKQLFNDWRKKSELTTVESDFNDKVFDICVGRGAAVCGGAVGLIAKRFEYFYNYYEEALRICEENETEKKTEGEENRKKESITQNPHAAVDSGSLRLKSRTSTSAQRARAEIDIKINEYIGNHDNLNDPNVFARLESELEAIECKYF